MVQLHLYLTVVLGCRENTEALLALDSCRPVKAQKHNGDWDRIVTPLKLKVWERALASHTDQEFVPTSALGSWRDSASVSATKYQPANQFGKTCNLQGNIRRWWNSTWEWKGRHRECSAPSNPVTSLMSK